MRNDNVEAMREHRGRYAAGKALIILGGPSAANWQKLKDEFGPDVVIGCNGANIVPDLDYWLCTENMRFAFSESYTNRYGLGERSAQILEMFRRTGAKYRLVNWKSISFLTDPNDVIAIQRTGVELEGLPSFDFTSYDAGLINGALMQRPDIIKDMRSGSVALQAIHLACILGVRKIRTIGFDMCFKERHHWYKHPEYIQDGRFFFGDPFVEHLGLKTHVFWLDTLRYMSAVDAYLRLSGVEWRDHSDGLIQAAGLMAGRI